MRTLIPALTGAAVLATVALTGARSPQGGLEVGETPKYSFRSAPVNSMGIAGLDDLRGKPVLVEFWGTR